MKFARETKQDKITIAEGYEAAANGNEDNNPYTPLIDGNGKDINEKSNFIAAVGWTIGSDRWVAGLDVTGKKKRK